MKHCIPLLVFLAGMLSSLAQSPSPAHVSFSVTPVPESQAYKVSFSISGNDRDTLELKLPSWTPGYYQIMSYANQVFDFNAETEEGKSLVWKKAGLNRWKIASNKSSQVRVTYQVKATRSFVATSYVDSLRAYITPGGIFMHVAGMLNHSADVTLHPYQGWNMIATGLKPGNTANSFFASDFDVLYDSPILMGKLEQLPTFEVRGVPHRFIGYQLGDFDRQQFISDLKKIAEAATNIIDDIPFRDYTFIAIGPGQGGLEHLNSTAFSFSGSGLNTPEGKRRMYSFLAHEYFHHYNVKRIRPIELGPFDYDRENRTNMLWVSEGFTVYYDMLIVRRAGLSTTEELLSDIRSRLRAYETKPGRLYQSVTQASYATWSDGPFGRTDDEVNKTVSVYDKGAVLGLLLDFTIRHHTKNKKSLDDVMQSIYKEYYQDKKRGFTEDEFKTVCEKIAGTPLPEIFDYASTVKPIDYKKYFAHGGLEIDTEAKPLAGGWLGLSTRMRRDSLVVSAVDYESPAWNAGMRSQMIILSINGSAPRATTLQPLMNEMKAGERLEIKALVNGKERNFSVVTGTKIEPSFTITVMAKPTRLQKEILDSWVKQ